MRGVVSGRAASGGSGRADGRDEGRRSLLVGSEAVWREGDGTAEIDVEVGVGEATVFLD